MKTSLPLLFLFFAFIFCAADCPCGNTGTSSHHRWDVKTRHPGSAGHASKYTFAKLCKLKISNDQLEQVRHDPTLVLPNENKIIKITGYLRLLKESPDDCDLHMEIATLKSNGAFRFIAEVPNTDEYCDLREEIFTQLQNRYQLARKKKYEFGTSSMPELPRITVTGFVFFDNSHFSQADPDAGHNHGSALVQTLWELHPVFKISWL